MEDGEGLAFRAIRLGVAAHACRQAAVDHPQAARGLLRAAETYSGLANAALTGIVERAERVKRRLNVAR